MVEEAMRTAIGELNKRQATIDALVEALEDALPYVGRYESEHMSNVALGVITKADAALALARGQGGV